LTGSSAAVDGQTRRLRALNSGRRIVRGGVVVFISQNFGAYRAPLYVL
jgi:hypothetical protein